MEQDREKKPTGPVDLADLRSKLGLTKPGAGVPTPSSPVPAAMPGPGIPAPGIPSPGVPRADIRRDPFAPAPVASPMAYAPTMPAQPHAAFYDAGPQLEIPVAKKPLMPKILVGIGLVAVATLAFSWGLVYRSRLLANKAIDDAKEIHDRAAAIGKKQQEIYAVLNLSVERARQANRNPYLPDLELIEGLKLLLPLDPPNTDKIFRVDYTLLENVVIENLFTHYNDTLRLYSAVTLFVEKWGKEETQADLKKIQESAEKAAAEGGATTYGVVIDPTGPIPIGSLVEMGTPTCPDGGMECPADQILSFKMRSKVGGEWTDRKLRGQDGERIIPISPLLALAPAVLGGIQQITWREYQVQLADIQKLATELTKASKDLKESLAKAAGKKKVFTF